MLQQNGKTRISGWIAAKILLYSRGKLTQKIISVLVKMKIENWYYLPFMIQPVVLMATSVAVKGSSPRAPVFGG
jgi:hypothetical protein